MKYTLTIQTDDANEIARAIINAGTKVSVVETKVEPASETKVEEVSEKRPVGRPRRTAETAKVEDNGELETPALTLEKVQAKLTEVARKFGKPAAIEILAKLSVVKSDQLKAEQYAEAIAQCESKLSDESL